MYSVNIEEVSKEKLIKPCNSTSLENLHVLSVNIIYYFLLNDSNKFYATKNELMSELV